MSSKRSFITILSYGVGHCGKRPVSTKQVVPDTITRMNEEATYICDNCGEEIVVPVDPSAGSSQEYVEDCPVCCNPNVIHVEIDEDGNVRVWGEAEQDRY